MEQGRVRGTAVLNWWLVCLVQSKHGARSVVKSVEEAERARQWGEWGQGCGERGVVEGGGGGGGGGRRAGE